MRKEKDVKQYENFGENVRLDRITIINSTHVMIAVFSLHFACKWRMNGRIDDPYKIGKFAGKNKRLKKYVR